MKRIPLLFLFALLLTGCPDRREEKPSPGSMPDEEMELSEAAFDELEGWQEDEMAEMADLFAANCGKIEKLKTPFIDNSRIKIDSAGYRRVCTEFFRRKINKGSEFKVFVEENFTPFLVQTDGNAEGKFTSYYESEIHASRSRHDKYVYPVYGRPADLIELNLKDFDPDLPNMRLVGRVSGQKMLPYYTREEIEKAPFAAPVLLWGDSAVDIHIMQIQGSAVAKLDDGSSVRIGYADNNGRRFRGIGSILLAKGLLKPGKADMISIKKWLNDNPAEAQKLMRENERYIFHRIIEGKGPVGAFGVPLTAGRSLAVDRRYVPLGALMWLSTRTPDGKPLNKMVAAQDIGGAIKGAVRGDYFWGSGGDEILAQAGKMNSAGHYYILIPKEAAGDK